MAHREYLPALLSLLVLGSGGCWNHTTDPGESDFSVTRQFDRTEPAPGIATVGISVANGGVEIWTSDVDRISANVVVEVRADTQREAEAFASALSIEVERNGSTLRMYADPPRAPIGIEWTTNWEVVVPSALDLDVEIVNGTLFASGSFAAVSAGVENGSLVLGGTAGPLRLATVNGVLNVDLEHLAGPAALTTINGRQTLAFASGNPSVAASAVNGTILVTLPSRYSGTLEAEVIHGGITSHLPPGDRLVFTPTTARGTLAQGGPDSVTLRTVNGGIGIGRSPE